MPDWLGNGNISNKDIEFLSYEDAKKLIIKNGIQSANDYAKFRKDNPQYKIPSQPNVSYKEWNSWPDFHGKE